jgi:hypothetical protein
LGSDKEHSQIEFGAHQAVLVRSQAAKETLPAEFDGALVLTIFEAKGACAGPALPAPQLL